MNYLDEEIEIAKYCGIPKMAKKGDVIDRNDYFLKANGVNAKTIAQLFLNNFDCYTQPDGGEEKMTMTGEMFLLCVSSIIRAVKGDA